MLPVPQIPAPTPQPCFDMNLLHLSDDSKIKAFSPRPLRTPVDHGPSREWLNGPLVWANDAAHSLLYLFPRECPRILLWPTPHTTVEDRKNWSILQPLQPA
ncbi:DUF6886 family protein [Paraburkholderia tropica]|uniref:DUF6886 family protein n=1 Tax=Paraburkholderia tropica TaxID=92647 RepID=UPI0035D51A04